MRGFVTAAADAIAVEVPVDVGQPALQRANLAGQLWRGTRRVLVGLAQVLEPRIGLTQGPPGAQHRALEPRDLLLERQQSLLVAGAECCRRKRDGLELDGAGELTPLAVDALRQRNGVRARDNHRPARRIGKRVFERRRLQTRRPGVRVAQIPCDAVDPGARRTGQAAHDVAVAVSDRQDDGRVFLALFRLHRLPTRVFVRLARLLAFLFGFLSLLLARFQSVLEVIRQRRADRRVGSRVERVSLEGFAA